MPQPFTFPLPRNPRAEALQPSGTHFHATPSHPFHLRVLGSEEVRYRLSSPASGTWLRGGSTLNWRPQENASTENKGLIGFVS
jgi:hypothetical protein